MNRKVVLEKTLAWTTGLSLILVFGLMLSFYFLWIDSLQNLPVLLISFAAFVFFLSNFLVIKSPSVTNRQMVAVGSSLGLILFVSCFTGMLKLDKHWNLGFAFSLMSFLFSIFMYAKQTQKWPKLFTVFSYGWIVLLGVFILLKLDFFFLSIFLRIGFGVFILGTLLFSFFKQN